MSHVMVTIALLDAGASVKVYCDSERNLKGIFSQDQQMKDVFKAYIPRALVPRCYVQVVGTRTPSVFYAL